MWDHISYGHTKWIIENTMHCIFIRDNKSAVPSIWTTKAVHADTYTCIGERVPWKLSSLPANNWADRRIPQIAELKSDDWIYYQPPFGTTISRHQVIHAIRIAKKSSKHGSHNHHLIITHIRSKYILKKSEAKYLYQCFILSKPIFPIMLSQSIFYLSPTIKFSWPYFLSFCAKQWATWICFFQIHSYPFPFPQWRITDL